MAHVERHIHIDAPPHVVWSVMTDVEHWPEWTASVRRIRPLDGAAPAVGRGYRICGRGTPPATWRVTALDEGRSFAWATGVRIIATHAIEAAPAGSNITLSIRTEGLLAAIFSPAIVRVARRNMDLEAEGLKRRSETK